MSPSLHVLDEERWRGEVVKARSKRNLLATLKAPLSVRTTRTLAQYATPASNGASPLVLVHKDESPKASARYTQQDPVHEHGKTHIHKSIHNIAVRPTPLAPGYPQQPLQISVQKLPVASSFLSSPQAQAQAQAHLSNEPRALGKLVIALPQMLLCQNVFSDE